MGKKKENYKFSQVTIFFMENYILILKTFRQNPTIPIHAMVLNKLLIRYLMSKSEKKVSVWTLKIYFFFNFYLFFTAFFYYFFENT